MWHSSTALISTRNIFVLNSFQTVRRSIITWLLLNYFHSVWCSLHFHHFHCKYICLWICSTPCAIHPRSSFSLQAHLLLNSFQTVWRLTITWLSLNNCHSVRCSLHFHHFPCKRVCRWIFSTPYGIHPHHHFHYKHICHSIVSTLYDVNPLLSLNVYATL